MNALRTLLLLVSVFAMYSCNTPSKSTKVELIVGEFKSRLYVNVLNQRFDLFKDSTGVATIDLDVITEPCFAVVEVGAIAKEIYLEPGNHVRITRKSAQEIYFEGDQANVNAFLNERTPIAIPSELYQSPLADFMKAFDKAAESYARLVNSKPELKHCAEMLTQNRNYLRWRIAIIKYFSSQQKLSKEGHSILKQFLREQNKQSYRFRPAPDAIDRCITALYQQDEPDYKNHSWDYGTGIKIKWLEENINDSYIKQNFIHAAVDAYIAYAGIDKGDDIFQLYTETVDNQTLLDKFNKKLDVYKKMSKGSEVPEFKFQDANGQTRLLNEFKGKYVYIDLWATWCHACIAQFPYLEALKKEYKDNNIVFLGLNTDMKFSYFTGYVEKHKIPGHQWYIGRNDAFDEFFKVWSQPRFILLDPQGKIHDAHMLRADKPEALKSYLNKLEGI
ncbi:TlpA family protein disulfide reductase [Carboxylicivirga marina]|uniref:TlpA family protein disulfide reductase n=1 Tax=Carboxylicivirga marina TaxID=2800988 RepID=UPI002598A80F|nr:TlpA disulfide reductase family protein [uncultured Carboxylicivirga sp.]